ncbi:MAG: hypothetical protein IKC79_01900, partial [Clostridia bacterium]|nr:hypothetical protein [Clostridia bacterium]
MQKLTKHRSNRYELFVRFLLSIILGVSVLFSFAMPTYSFSSNHAVSADTQTTQPQDASGTPSASTDSSSASDLDDLANLLPSDSYSPSQDTSTGPVDDTIVGINATTRNVIAGRASSTICKIYGRTFTKNNDEFALCGYIYNGKYTGPLLVGRTADSVAYKQTHDTTLCTYAGKTTYAGYEWYYSSAGYWMEGNYNDEANLNRYKISNSNHEAAAQNLIAQVYGGFSTMPSSSGTFKGGYFKASTASLSDLSVPAHSSVVLYIPKNITLTVTGSATKAAIYLPSTSNLIVTGPGTLVATGGSGGAGGGGGGGTAGTGYAWGIPGKGG